MNVLYKFHFEFLRRWKEIWSLNDMKFHFGVNILYVGEFIYKYLLLILTINEMYFWNTNQDLCISLCLDVPQRK